MNDSSAEKKFRFRIARRSLVKWSFFTGVIGTAQSLQAQFFPFLGNSANRTITSAVACAPVASGPIGSAGDLK